MCCCLCLAPLRHLNLMTLRNSGPTSGVTVQFAGSIYANRLNAKPISLLFSLYFLYLGPLTYHLDSAYILD